MQTMLGTPAANVLLASEVDFVNKGAASEMFAGLELVKNHDCFQKAEMYYWQSMSRGSNAEIDYLEAKEGGGCTNRSEGFHQRQYAKLMAIYEEESPSPCCSYFLGEFWDV